MGSKIACEDSDGAMRNASLPQEEFMRTAKRFRDDENGVSLPFPDRRAHKRERGVGEPDRRYLVSMIVGTYREMPGLTLRVNQAARLFGLRVNTCRIVLDDLVENGRLRRASDGQYTTA